MITGSDSGQAMAIVKAAFAKRGRDIAIVRDVHTRQLRFFDNEYGMELGAVNDGAVGLAMRNHDAGRDAARLIHEACREPTSLEILYYAQVGGPHVGGAS